MFPTVRLQLWTGLSFKTSFEHQSGLDRFWDCKVKEIYPENDQYVEEILTLYKVNIC